MNRRNVILSFGLSLFSSWIILFQPYIENQLVAGTTESDTASTDNSTLPAAVPEANLLYQGESLIMVQVGNFHNAAVWDPIDNLLSTGYDIKAVLQYNNGYAIIMENMAASE